MVRHDDDDDDDILATLNICQIVLQLIHPLHNIGVVKWEDTHRKLLVFHWSLIHGPNPPVDQTLSRPDSAENTTIPRPGPPVDLTLSRLHSRVDSTLPISHWYIDQSSYWPDLWDVHNLTQTRSSHPPIFSQASLCVDPLSLLTDVCQNIFLWCCG